MAKQVKIKIFFILKQFLLQKLIVCKMKFMNTFLIFLTVLITFIFNATTEHVEIVKNSNNITVFTILNNASVEIPNHYQNKISVLKFSIHSTTIENVTTFNSTSNRWSLNLQDKSSIEIISNTVHTNVTKYSIVWHREFNTSHREICLHYQEKFWFQGYMSKNSAWPMNKKDKIEKVQFNSMMEFDRYTAISPNLHLNEEFQFILEHLFVNSDGFAVHLDHLQPLFVRKDPNENDALICFSVFVDDHFYPKHHLNVTSDLDLKLKIFTSTNAKTVADYIVHKSPYIPKPTELPKDLSLFKYPTWTSDVIFEFEPTKNLFDETHIHNFSANLQKYKMSDKNEFLIEHYEWLDYRNNYTIDNNTFPNMSSFADRLLAKGVQLGGLLTSPQFLTNTHKHPEYDKYLLHNKHNFSLSYFDLTKPETAEFYKLLLSKVHNEYKINTFWLKSFTFWGAEFSDPLVSKYWSLFVTRYIETAFKASNATVVTEMAYKSQHLPVFTRMISYYTTSAKQMLKHLIPSVLSISLSGYSFIIPFPVGTFNDEFKSFNFNHLSEELYIRMVQATTFMPCMSFTRTPWNFTEKTVNLTKKYLNLHLEHSEVIIELAKKRIKDGTPIIRSMWYNYPDDTHAYTIGDQFMLGENILVAPVVEEKQLERNVYFPSGKWIDQHGKSFQGPLNVKIKSPLEELPYFKLFKG